MNIINEYLRSYKLPLSASKYIKSVQIDYTQNYEIILHGQLEVWQSGERGAEAIKRLLLQESAITTLFDEVENE